MNSFIYQENPLVSVLQNIEEKHKREHKTVGKDPKLKEIFKKMRIFT